MDIQLINDVITQHHLKFKINGKDIGVTLTRNFGMFGNWDLKGLEEINLNFEEIIEICELIHLYRIINGCEYIMVHLKDGETISICHGKQ